MNPTGIIRHYQRFSRQYLARQLEWFSACPSLETAIEHAALAIDGNGKRFAHQRRLIHEALAAAKRALLSTIAPLNLIRDFDVLIRLIEEIVAPIDGIGKLYVYDTSLRIGAKLGLLPEKVYLHAGTRDGAKVLGLDWRARALEPVSLPGWLRVLAPHEIEDFLCIYKDKLAEDGAPEPDNLGVAGSP